MEKKNSIALYCPTDWHDYEMLDTGEGERLERFGPHTFVRPYEDAFWKKSLSKGAWEKADGKFWSSKTGAKSGWKMTTELAPRWEMSYRDITFYASPTPFRHLGFFPEQASQWDFIEKTIKASGRKIKFLNLFGYTGVASLFAARAGAEVTHVDASKQTLIWAKENAILSGISNVRYLLDDAMKFIEREEKRGNTYDAIIMDPPKFGRGPKGEIWKLEEKLPKLLAQVRKILSDTPLFIILTSYATDSSALTLGYNLADAVKGLKGSIEQGELCVFDTGNNRPVPFAHIARFTAE